MGEIFEGEVGFDTDWISESNLSFQILGSDPDCYLIIVSL